MTVTSPRNSAIGFPSVKTTHPNEEEHRRELADGVNRALLGKLNITGSVTLTANAASTTITDARIGTNTAVVLVPITNLNAAAALTNIYQTYPNTTEGQAVLNHTNNAQTDRTFRYVLIG